MTMMLRTDDFRCFDPRLVEIIKGRESEAVEFALASHGRGQIDGIFVNGSGIDNWKFLEAAAPIPRYAFNSPSKTLRPYLALLSNAEDIRLNNHDFAVDLSLFPRLTNLILHWHKRNSNLEALHRLKRLTIFQVGKSSLPILPANLEHLELNYYAPDRLASSSPLAKLRTLRIFSARNLSILPSLENVDSIHLSHISKSFDYSSLPASVKHLELVSCPEISDWNSIGHLKLHSLNLISTKAPKSPFPLV